jgi:hypothetical protein
MAGVDGVVGVVGWVSNPLGGTGDVLGDVGL